MFFVDADITMIQDPFTKLAPYLRDPNIDYIFQQNRGDFNFGGCNNGCAFVCSVSGGCNRTVGSPLPVS